MITLKLKGVKPFAFHSFIEFNYPSFLFQLVLSSWRWHIPHSEESGQPLCQVWSKYRAYIHGKGRESLEETTISKILNNVPFIFFLLIMLYNSYQRSRNWLRYVYILCVCFSVCLVEQKTQVSFCCRWNVLSLESYA